MADVLFKSGTYAKYISLAVKDDNTIYFIDNGQIYKGATVGNFLKVMCLIQTKLLWFPHSPVLL